MAELQPPTLDREDIARELSECLSRRREHHRFAFFGTGTAGPVKLKDERQAQVYPVGSELELRETLLTLDSSAGDEGPVAFLVPFQQSLPLDLAGTFALGGRVHVISRHSRLRRLFGVLSLEPGVLESPLCSYLLSKPGELPSLQVGGVTLSEAELVQTWLARAWEVPCEGGLALDSLLAWAARNGRGPSFAAALAPAPKVLAALHDHLRGALGPAGPVAFAAWTRGQGERLLQYALLFEALSDQAGLGLWVRTQVRSALQVPAEEDAERIARDLAEAVTTALPLYATEERRRSAEHALLSRAEALVDDAEVRAALIHSPRLPHGFRLRLDNLGRALLAALQQLQTHAQPAQAESPGACPDCLPPVLAAKAALQRHQSYLDDRHEAEINRAEMAVRLLSFLASDHSLLQPGVAESLDMDVARLGRWYAEQGGFVDWARRLCRGPEHHDFGRGVGAVVRAVDDLRKQLDHRFARALAAHSESLRPAGPGAEVLPIERVTERVLTPFLQGHDERKLLVLLLDGMAWTQATELLSGLAEQVDGWGPVRWHASGRKHKLGSARTPVVLAALPTLTEVSRAAFFAGARMEVGKTHRTEDDRKRFADNGVVRRFFAGSDVPRLFLRAEGHTAAGEPSNEVLTAIAQPERVVAVVINAIDASLKGDSQHLIHWHPNTIRPLPKLLEAARDTGRTVLLASDHGHVPADRFEQSAGQLTEGARWRALADKDAPVADYEVKFSGNGVWRPKGAEAVALLADDRHRYGGVGAHAGEHGGATLAEVVAPCVLIHWDDTLGSQADPERRPDALFIPGWWHFDVGHSPALSLATEGDAPQGDGLPSAAHKPERRGKKAAVSDQQLSLLPEVAAPAAPEPAVALPEPTPPAAPALSPVAKELAQLPSVKALSDGDQHEVLRTVDYLLYRNGNAQVAALAAHLRMQPGRVGGFVSRKLQRALNLDGFQVITYDHQEVKLDLGILSQLYGVSV